MQLPAHHLLLQVIEELQAQWIFEEISLLISSIYFFDHCVSFINAFVEMVMLYGNMFVVMSHLRRLRHLQSAIAVLKNCTLHRITVFTCDYDYTNLFEYTHHWDCFT